MYDTTNNTVKEVEYLDGFQYTGGELNFFPHAEGYVNVTKSNSVSNPYIYNYVYNYTDHLGNIRLSYTKDAVTGDLKILEENHYYPFGLKHKVYAGSLKMDFKEDEELEGVARPEYVYSTQYNYKYNTREYQDELGLNWTSIDFRNYDAAIGRFHVIDPLSDLAPMHNPYRFGFNNPVYWRDPSGLFESNGFETCPTCPNTPEFKPFIDDPNNEYVYDPNTNSVTPVIELDGATVTGKAKKSDDALDYVGYGNDLVGGVGDGLWETQNKGGSFRLFKNKATGYEWAPKYYPDNRFGSSIASKHPVYNVSKTLKKGTLVTSVILEIPDVAEAVSEDKGFGKNAKRETAGAIGSILGGIWVGGEFGAVASSYTGNPFIIGGATILGGIVGGVAGEDAAENLVESIPESSYKGEPILNKR